MKYKNKKIVKKVVIYVLFILMIYANLCTCKADITFDNIKGTQVSNSEAQNIGNKIITLVSTIGSISSVVVLVIIGLKYMLGSVEEKAEYKKSLMPYMIGSMIVFSGSSLAGIIYSIANIW